MTDLTTEEKQQVLQYFIESLDAKTLHFLDIIATIEGDSTGEILVRHFYKTLVQYHPYLQVNKENWERIRFDTEHKKFYLYPLENKGKNKKTP